MYDIDKYKKLESVTVKTLIETLKTFASDAEVLLCGFDKLYIHVDKGGAVINLDVESKDYFSDQYENYESENL